MVTIGTWQITKTDSLGTASILPSELEDTVLVVAAAGTGAIRIVNLADEEFSLAFISVAPGALDYMIELHEHLPTTGLTLKYSIVRLAASLENGELLLDSRISFRHPVEIHVVDGGPGATYEVTYRLLTRQRLGKY